MHSTNKVWRGKRWIFDSHQFSIWCLTHKATMDNGKLVWPWNGDARYKCAHNLPFAIVFYHGCPDVPYTSKSRLTTFISLHSVRIFAYYMPSFPFAFYQVVLPNDIEMPHNNRSVHMQFPIKFCYQASMYPIHDLSSLPS